MATEHGQRISPQVLAAALPEWHEIRRPVLKIRRKATYGIAALLIAIPFSWFFLRTAFLAPAGVLAIMALQVYYDVDMGAVRRVGSHDIGRNIGAILHIQFDGSGEKRSTSRLEVGALVCSYKEWQDWRREHSPLPSPESQSTSELASHDAANIRELLPGAMAVPAIFELLLAVRPVGYSDRLELGFCSGAIVTDAPEKEFQAISGQTVSTGVQKLELAAAIVDLLEVIDAELPWQDAFVAGPDGTITGHSDRAGHDGELNSYWTLWGHSQEAVYHAIRVAVAAQLATWVDDHRKTHLFTSEVRQTFFDLSRTEPKAESGFSWMQIAGLVLRPPVT